MLRGLPEAAVARLLPPGTVVAPGALHTLHERTAGNPFFLRELLRMLAERGALGADEPAALLVPDRVREVVAQRLEPLAPLDARGARDRRRGRPAVHDRRASPASAGCRARRSPTALEPALAGRLVEARPDSPGRFGFAHAIVRDAVYDELAPAQRARVHAAVADLLQESLDAGGDATAAEAAHHALAAARCGADPQPAWALSLEAAREAAGLQAHAEAAAHYGGALEALELGAEAGCDRAAGDHAGARGRRVRGRRHRGGAAPLPHRRGGRAPQRRRRAAGARGDRVLRGPAVRRDRRRTRSRCCRTRCDALPPHDGALRARASARLGLRLDPVTDQDRREALARRRRRDGAAARRRRGADRLLSAAAMVNWPPARVAARAAATDEVLALTAAPRLDLAAVFWARTMRLRDALEAGDLDTVDAELDRLARLAADSRRTYFRWCLLVLQAARALFAGRLAEGERLADEAVELNRRHGDDADQEYTVARLALALLRRRPQDAPVAELRDYAARYPALPVWEAMRARVGARARLDAAPRSVEACARDGFAAVLRTARLALRARPARRAGRGARAPRRRSSSSSPRSPRTPVATR